MIEDLTYRCDGCNTRVVVNRGAVVGAVLGSGDRDRGERDDAARGGVPW